MAKKRLRKLLKKAVPLLAIAGLGRAFMNRNRGTAQGVSGADKGLFTSNAAYSGSDNMPKGIDKVISNVTNPNINLGRMTGSGPSKGEIGQNIRANYARKMRNIASDRNRNDMLRAIRSNVDMATTPDSILQGVPEAALMAKDGGRIVKGEKVAKLKKKKSIQIRGFGKARKK
tara:strand:+ start:35 stop:553 length:519 start_codon:yes stop_codon:yes gene_type:complete